jgi:hypothetical protein
MVWRLCGHRCHPSTHSPAEALAAAAENIAGFAALGIMERFDDFVTMLLHATDTPSGIADAGSHVRSLSFHLSL